MENNLAKEMARKIRLWSQSPEGKKTIKKALKDSRKMAEQLQKARQIDPKTLHEPMTI